MAESHEEQDWQWILWAVAMVIFLALTLSGHYDWLGLAIMRRFARVVHGCAASPTSRQQ